MIDAVKRYAASRDGNFAMMTAILAVPLVTIVAFATDYASISTSRAKLQAVTDGAALAVARHGTTLSQAESENIASRFLTAHLRTAPIGYSVKRDGSKITVEAEIDAGTHFDEFFGGKNWTVKVNSTSDITTQAYEIGLVLDTTGSMKGGKLQAMKDAVTGMIDTMSAQVKEKNKLKFALVPFSTFVNVGSQQGPAFDNKYKQIAGTGKPWLDLQGEEVFPQSEFSAGASRFQIYKNMNQNWPGCVESRYAPGKSYDVDDTLPSASVDGSLFVPTLAPDEPDGSGFTNNYINSSAVPYRQEPGQKKKRWDKYGVETDTAGNPQDGGLLKAVLRLLLGGPKPIPIDTSLSSYWGDPKGPGLACSTKPIVPLSTDTAELKRRVMELEAKGNTNITEGVAWGMRVLSPDEPFTEGVSFNKKQVRKVMVVLTDGANTLGPRSNEYASHYSAYGFLADGRLNPSGSSEQAINDAMNKRTLAACQVAKDAGVEVYTIRLEEPHVKTGTMLRECASSPAHYFDVPNRSQLDEAFKGIKDLVTVVRLSS